MEKTFPSDTLNLFSIISQFESETGTQEGYFGLSRFFQKLCRDSRIIPWPLLLTPFPTHNYYYPIIRCCIIN